MLYSKNNAYPGALPHRITLSGGTTRTEPSTFTEGEIADAGYLVVADPPTTEYPNKLFWNFTEWVVREPNEFEISNKWQEIKAECLRQLSATDYKIIKAVEQNVAVDPAYIQYRQELRDLYNNINDVDPWFVEFPIVEEQTLPNTEENTETTQES